ncbi:MAG: OmpA family protein [Bacteroidia bacterium]|nr:OmpA family protein [Bacteroidia bacterium]NNC85697.1 OmpA family protein [Bacteroidia bacterium]NNM16579.1 OmpA family protein [Bacteroidia bacterium]
MKNRIVSYFKYLVLALTVFAFSCNEQITQQINAKKNEILKEQTSKINELLQAKEQIIGDFVNGENDASNIFGSYEIKNISVNTKEDDFSPSIVVTDTEEYVSTRIVFASANKNRSNYIKYQKKNNNRPLMDMFCSYLKEDQTFSKPESLEKCIPWIFEDSLLNTDYHDGVVTFTNNGKKMYLTQNNDSLSSEDTLNLIIISFTETNGVWRKDKKNEFEYNHPEYSCAHPTISEDGNRLIFSSDMPGGIGGMDLYVRYRLYDGTWGAAKNLGPGINTEGNEIFPTINVDDALHFASDGHKGLGGLDIYKTFRSELGKWNFPVNIGDPINSPLDDFGITFFSEGDSGYFCSNRPGGKGNDDIYFFKGTNNPNIIEITVIDSLTENPLDSVLVKIATCNDGSTSGITDIKGKLTNIISSNLICKITALKDDYIPKTINFKDVDISKDPPFKKIIRIKKEAFVVGKKYDLPKIFYDLDKATLRFESKIALDDLVRTLEENPNITIKLIAHTDSRAPDPYNQKLSNRRAKSVVDYLISKKIPEDRLTSEGRGEQDLRIADKEISRMGSEAEKEEAHQKNRRTEFEVLSTTYTPKK